MDKDNQQSNINFDSLLTSSNKALGSVTGIASKLGLKATLLSVASTIENAARNGLAASIKESSLILSSQSGKAVTYMAPSFGMFVLANSFDPTDARVALEECLKILASPSPFDGNTLASISGAISHVKTNKEAMFAGIAGITTGGVSVAARYLANRCKDYIPKISPSFYENTVKNMARQIVTKFDNSPEHLTEIEKVELAFESILNEQEPWISSDKLNMKLVNQLGRLAAEEHRSEVEEQQNKTPELSYPHVVM